MSEDEIGSFGLKAKISESIEGKTVKDVLYKKRWKGHEPDDDSKTEFGMDASRIVVLFEDDTAIKFWISEWGGIEYGQFILEEKNNFQKFDLEDLEE